MKFPWADGLPMNSVLLLFAVLAGVLAMPAAAYARADAPTDLSRELKDAQAALAARDYATAYPLYLRSAQNDNPLAAFTVALFHQSGWGRPVDRAQACHWFERAAKGKIPSAAHFFAECWADGGGSSADAAKAAHWYRQAAALGHHVSLCALADLYMAGRGVPKDPKKGLALCRQAAQQGSLPAAVKTGRYLLEGDETIRDAAAAHDWFKSTAPKSPAARFYLGLIYRDGIGRPPSVADGRYWFESAASQGYVPAYYPTARLYLRPSEDGKFRRPSAEFLAKAYMWLQATEKRSRDRRELEQTRALLKQVLSIMPESWKTALDERVSAHLKDNPAMR